MVKEYIRVAEVVELPPGKMTCIEVANRFLLLANVEGQFYAADELCTHEDASLSDGVLEGHCVTCPLHGSRFDLETGQPLEEPAEEPLRVYPVRIENGQVLVCLEPDSQ